MCVSGLADWEEDDIIARVMAQSKQEYLETLKKSTSSPPRPATTFASPSSLFSPSSSSSTSMSGESSESTLETQTQKKDS